MVKRGGWNDSQSLMIKPGSQGQIQTQASWEWPWLRSWISWWKCPGLLPALVSAHQRADGFPWHPWLQLPAHHGKRGSWGRILSVH